MQLLKGTQLNYDDRKHVLSAYVHRYTGNNKPSWVKSDATPVQFTDDNDWLANTVFHCTKSGRLDKRYHACWSNPTWPLNPELRK